MIFICAFAELIIQCVMRNLAKLTCINIYILSWHRQKVFGSHLDSACSTSWSLVRVTKWNLTHFSSIKNMFLIIVRFLEHFYTYCIIDKTMKANFEGLSVFQGNDLKLIMHTYWTSKFWSIDSCQNRVPADQYHLTVSRAQVSTHRGQVFFLSYSLTSY